MDVSFNPTQHDGGGAPVGMPLQANSCTCYGVLDAPPENANHKRYGAVYELTP